MQRKAWKALRSLGRRQKALLSAAAVLLSVVPAKAQLSGTYTVCSSGCNYASVADAFADLKSAGVSGPVTFNITPDTYSGALSATSSINGVSSTNTITFQGTGPGTIITGSPTRLLDLRNQEYMTFKDLVFENTSTSSSTYNVYLSSCEQMTFDNVVMLRPNSTSTSYNFYSTGGKYITVQNSTLRGAYYGMYFTRSSSTSYGYDLVKNNRITQFYYYGLYTNYGYSDTYEGNYIDSNTNASFGYGARIYYESGATIKNNIIPADGGIYYGMYLYYPNNNSTTLPYVVENNMVGNLNSGGYLYYPIYCYAYSSSNVKFRHNTLASGRANTQVFYFYNYSGSDNEVRNNIFYRSNVGQVAYTWQVNSSNIWDNNNLYNTGGTLIYQGGTNYSSLSAWKAAHASTGQAQNDVNSNVTFLGTYDLHVDQSTVTPYGKSVGILRDLDGDQRCERFPTLGADESSFGKTSNTAKFYAPSNIIEGSPTVFMNSAKVGEPKEFIWYIDGVRVTPDSIHLNTTKLKAPSATISLVSIGCSGIDSTAQVVTVNAPTKAPVSDFLANKSIIKQGEIVRFMDLSINGPSQWTWNITPTNGIVNGNKSDAYKYIWGSNSTPNNLVRFDLPGKYKVCLTASNSIGTGTSECKTAYIEVVPTVNIGDVAEVRESSGYLYDDGGPNGNYTGYAVRKILLNPCADSVYLVFNKFDLNCGYSYIRVWEGKDSKGKEITPCTNNRLYGNTSGYTGGAGSSSPGCAADCRPDTDTLKAKGYMYIEMDASYAYNASGFEAYWWSKPKQQQPPVAKFTSADSICVNGAVTFTDASSGDEIRYYWDLDPNEEGFEYTGNKPTSWVYFFPGNYEITLVAENCGGIDTFRKTIKVFEPKTPDATFKADNKNPGTNDIVFFSSTSTACVDQYKWTFTHQGDSTQVEFVNGSSETSGNPQVVFPATGCWDVTLEVTNSTGTDKKTVTCYISAKDAYCVPSVATTIPDIGISQVVFNTIDNTTSQGVVDYSNYVPTISTKVEAGIKYQLTVKRTTDKNPMNRTLYIDWNGDGDFSDPQELYAEELAAKTLDWNVDVTVPSFATRGATIMRIAVNIGTYANKECGQNEYGEYEDYRLYIEDFTTLPVIKLLGNAIDTIEQGAVYVDSGAVASSKLYGNISSSIVMTEKPKFNSLIPGTYEFTYNVTDASGNKAVPVTRKVVVTNDRTAPVLVVEQPDTVEVGIGHAFVVPQVLSAMDNVDGDVSASVSVNNGVTLTVVGTYTVKYSVTDFSGNTAEVIRVVNVVDTTAPVLSLVGQDTIYHEVFAIFNDPGVDVDDNYYSEADLRAKLAVNGTVDISKLGTYVLNYALSDGSGNNAVSISRVVVVRDTQKPLVQLRGLDTVTVRVFDRYREEGIIINDNFDKNMTKWDTMGTFYTQFPNGKTDDLGLFTVIYSVTDASGNTTTITRYVNVVDDEAPVLTLKGQPLAEVCRWAEYVDAGVDTSDNFFSNKDITVSMEGNFVNNSTMLDGLYTFRYKGVDKAGNVGYSEWRYIMVKKPTDYPCYQISGLTETEKLDKAVTVYPNPNAGRFVIKAELPRTEQVRISLTDVMGREIVVLSQGSLQSGTFEADLTTQPSGVYLLNVTTANGKIVKRISVNR